MSSYKPQKRQFNPKHKLSREFFERNTLQVAEDLLGKILVIKTKHGEIAGEIVETEAYIGPYDKASHTYNNRNTDRTRVQFGKRGCAYIFSIYYKYHCLCVVAGPGNTPAAVLVRAVKPLCGLDIMKKNRCLKDESDNNLTNGPAKFCQAFGITRKLNGTDLLGEEFFICEGGPKLETCKSARVGIDYAEEYKNVPWRFYVKGNRFVSKARPSTRKTKLGKREGSR
jgi:DNA-3-methyladenine glycosylase